MEDTTAAFGAVLRRFRVAAALSQEELAARSDVSARGISDLERGLRRGPRPETLRRLADALALEGPDRALLYAVAHPERPGTPIRRPTREATTLSLPGRPLFGRDEDRAALVALLCRSDVKLVTITGAGGTGKTHLALDVASRLTAAFPDGVVFVDLVPLVDPTDVLPAVAMALGIGEAPEQSLRDGLIAALREQRLLLLLDNCEQVLGAAPEIGAVFAACSALTVLATSREALHLRDEREWPLAPLPLPDLDRLPALAALQHSPAVALFTARAEASDPRFSLTAQNARAVATICHRVDGIPLAIELAAARVKHLTPVELASRLQQRLPLLTGGQRDAPARQRTLHDAIAWSYDLLTPREQAVFRSLSVFVGGWTIEAAEAVVIPAAGLNVLDILGSLLDKSLMRVDARGDVSRFAMLETVREFALEQLAREGEREATRERHAAYVLQLAESGNVAFEGVEQKQWLAMLECEHPNIREAFAAMETRGDDEGYLRLAGALHLFWCFRTHAAEGLLRLQRALADETGDPVARARALVGAGSLAWAVGDYPNAERWLRQAESLARELGEQPLLAQALFLRGAVAEDAGDEVATEARYFAALAVAQAIDHTWLVSALLTNLGDAAYRRGELDVAERFALDAIAPLRESRNAYMACMNLANLAQVALARGDIGRAVAALRDGLRIAEEIESGWNVANIIGCVAAIAAARRTDDQAATFLGAADAACDLSGHRRLPSHFLFAQTLETVRSRLGPDRFQCAWDAGRAHSVEDVLDDVRTVIAETGGDAIPHNDRPDG